MKKRKLTSVLFMMDCAKGGGDFFDNGLAMARTQTRIAIGMI